MYLDMLEATDIRFSYKIDKWWDGENSWVNFTAPLILHVGVHGITQHHVKFRKIMEYMYIYWEVAQ